MAKYKHVYRTMLEDDRGYRHGRCGSTKYDSKPKGKRDRKVRRK